MADRPLFEGMDEQEREVAPQQLPRDHPDRPQSGRRSEDTTAGDVVEGVAVPVSGVGAGFAGGPHAAPIATTDPQRPDSPLIGDEEQEP